MVSQTQSQRQQLLARLQEIQREEQQIVQRLLRCEEEEQSVKSDTAQRVAARDEHWKSMRGTVIHYGDIISPAADPDEWDANR